MKLFALLLVFTCFIIPFSQSQNSETFIPKDVSSIYSLNNVRLFEKISIDELINYDFMEELQSEVFDGSTKSIALDQIGIDLQKKFNIFYGRTNEYIISGCSFNLKDKELFFKAFDDYEFSYTTNDASIYSSLMNTLIIENEIGVILRVEPTDNYVNNLCDSIWYEQGNADPFFELNEIDFESIDEEIYDENISTNVSFPIASEDPVIKNYFELRDSISFDLVDQKMKLIKEEILVNKVSFYSSNRVYQELMEHDSDAMFYSHNKNSSNLQLNWLVQIFAENLNSDISEIYKNNIITGDLFLNQSQIDLNLNLYYEEALGQIYEAMPSKKFNKRILKYIPNTSSGYFNYNLNLKNVYHQLYEVLSPILEKEQNSDVNLNILLMDLLYETLNDKKLFKQLNGNVFGYFNGIQSVPIKRVEFIYDEENFEYQEITSTVLEDVPTFAFGMITEDHELQNVLLNRLSRLVPDLSKEGNLYKWENKILNSLPLYILSNEDALIFTNDETLIKCGDKGFEKNALSKNNVGELVKNSLLYMNLDLNETLDYFPLDFFPALDNNLIYPLKGKSGNVILRTEEASKERTQLRVNYAYPPEERPYIHVLDLINAMYVVTKQ